MAFPANHKEVQQNCAKTITGKISEFNFNNVKDYSWQILPVSFSLARG